MGPVSAGRVDVVFGGMWLEEAGSGTVRPRPVLRWPKISCVDNAVRRVVPRSAGVPPREVVAGDTRERVARLEIRGPSDFRAVPVAVGDRRFPLLPNVSRRRTSSAADGWEASASWVSVALAILCPPIAPIRWLPSEHTDKRSRRGAAGRSQAAPSADARDLPPAPRLPSHDRVAQPAPDAVARQHALARPPVRRCGPAARPVRHV